MAEFTSVRTPALLLSVVATITIAALADDATHIKVGIIHKAVRLTCAAPADVIPRIQWADFVYNSDRNPKVIADSANGGQINQKHPRHKVYMVDKKMTLTIKNVTLEDAGPYFCRVKHEDGTFTELHKFKLAVISMPDCKGKTSLMTGEDATMSCGVMFNSNELPVVEWFSQGVVQSGDEEAGLEEFKVNLRITGVTSANDQQEYVCNISIADQTQSCKLKLNVKYPVQDIKITPQQETYSVGDVIKCEAMGNPTPTVEWMPKVEGTKMGAGWHSFEVDKRWQGKAQNFRCTASNMVGSETSILSHNISFTPKEAPLAANTNGGAEAYGRAEAVLMAGLAVPAVLALVIMATATSPQQLSNGAAILVLAAILATGVPKIGVIIAVAAGAVVLVIIIIVAICVARKRSEKKKGHMQIPTSEHEELKKQAEAKA